MTGGGTPPPRDRGDLPPGVVSRRLLDTGVGRGALRLAVHAETWPLADTFRISRGARDEANVLVAELALSSGIRGRGECVPYGRYGESRESVLEQMRDAARAGFEDREALQDILPPGAARNALDCALWDLEAKRSGRRVWALAGEPPPPPVTSAYTVSLDSPERMAARAARARAFPLLKLKLDAEEPLARVGAVRQAAPSSELIVDANEAWSAPQLLEWLPALADLGVVLVEQPLPAAEDAALPPPPHPVPLCADESCHTRADLPRLEARYELVNIKLDKTGGLTEAFATAREARARGFGIMVGCMVGTSLAMAPAMPIAARARFVDLDGPLLLARDREPSLVPTAGTGAPGRLLPPEAALWG